MRAKPKEKATNVQDAIEEITAEKGLDAGTIQQAIEEAISESFRQQFKTEMKVKAVLKPNGRFTILGAKTVVEAVSDPLTEIAQSDPRARQYGLGDSVFVEVTSADAARDDDDDRLTDRFGRVAALLAKQIIRQRLREAERRRIYEEFKGREGEMVHGKVQRVRHGNVIVDLGRTEAILPRRELIPREKFKENDRVKAVISEVRLEPKGPQVVLSRAHQWLVRRLFEMEITEVYDGTVEIKAIAREAGFRTKVAVSSRDAAVDPVGACVGQKGIRVQTVVKELGGEKIDIVYWEQEPTSFIRNSLLPAEVDRVILDDHKKVAEVIVPEDQLSLAIGKDGQNARLAAKLTDYAINIRSKGEMERQKMREFIKLTFGMAPAEMLARIGVGAETAPVLEQAGFTDLEKLSLTPVASLAPLVGESAAVVILDSAARNWREMQEQAARIMDESADREKKGGRKAEPVATTFTLPGGAVVAGMKELVAALDELPGDEVMTLISSEELKNWLQEIGIPPEEIAELMARYR